MANQEATSADVNADDNVDNTENADDNSRENNAMDICTDEDILTPNRNAQHSIGMGASEFRDNWMNQLI